MKNIKSNIGDSQQLRRRHGLTQTKFWGTVGVTQSSGARYELGSCMPWPVQELLRLHYIECIDTSRLNGEDATLLSYLKSEETETFEELRKRHARFQQKARRPLSEKYFG